MIILDVEQGSDEWHFERFGCVTGTRIQSAIGAKWISKKEYWSIGDNKIQKTLMYELISERMSNNDIDNYKSRDMQRGNDLEPFAIKAASEKRDCEFCECGMLSSENIIGFKYSPDAVHYEKGAIIGGCETKCPNGKKHIEYMIKNEIPKEYFWQVMGPFIMSDDIKWWDFASYDDRNFQRELFLLRVYACDHKDIIESARSELVRFLDLVDKTHKKLINQ